MKGIDLLVSLSIKPTAFDIQPATKMNNGKKNEECPVINEQSGQHHCKAKIRAVIVLVLNVCRLKPC